MDQAIVYPHLVIVGAILPINPEFVVDMRNQTLDPIHHKVVASTFYLDQDLPQSKHGALQFSDENVSNHELRSNEVKKFTLMSCSILPVSIHFHQFRTAKYRLARRHLSFWFVNR